MSVGPMGGLPACAAGLSLAQSKGSDIDRTQQDTAVQQRQVKSGEKAESAAGIGEADGEDHATGERDADGRRLWEEMPGGNHGEPNSEQEQGHGGCKDPSGERGNLLDLSG